MPSPRLLDQVRDRLRVKHYSLRTEDSYLHWIRRFIAFHGKKHPREMGGPQVEAFLSHLATVGRVAASTQNQALSALLFLYREVLQFDLPWLDGVVRAKRPKHVPVVLTENEVRALLAQLEGTRWLVVSLLYSSGMRLLEGLRLRVKDVDFERHEITVRDGKGARDRVTMLPARLVEPLGSHLARVRVCCTNATLPKFTARSICLLRWRASTRKPGAAGSGSTFFRRAAARSIRQTASFGGIIWTRRSCSAQSLLRRALRGWRNLPRLMCVAIRSSPTCFSRDTISARRRNCSGIRTCPRR